MVNAADISRDKFQSLATSGVAYVKLQHVLFLFFARCVFNLALRALLKILGIRKHFSLRCIAYVVCGALRT